MICRPFVFALLCMLLFTACQHSQKEMIERRWQEVSIINPQMDAAMRDQESFLDTLGAHTDADANMMLYGTNNLDSLKHGLREEIQLFRQAQDKVVKNTWFDFREDGIVQLHSDEGLDSANWYFDDDRNLVLDELKLKGSGTQMIMAVKQLSDTALQLSLNENGAVSEMRFHPADAKK